MLSYLIVREAIAAKILEFHKCSPDENKSDSISKYWDHAIIKDTREVFAITVT